jgi:hypothetical protein
MLSSSVDAGKQVVTVARDSGDVGKKAPPRLRKPSSHDDAVLAPTADLQEHRTALRRVFGETLSDEFD